MKQKEPLEIELAPEDEWEVEQGSEEEQLQQEQLKVERLQMAIRGFTIALQEEIKGL
jgi:hypothetical protein